MLVFFGLSLRFCNGMFGMLVYLLLDFSLVFLCVTISVYDMILDSWLLVINRSS